MKKQTKKFSIDKFVKPGFDLCVELDDEVEYWVDEQAIESIRNNESTIILIRLIDGQKIVIATKKVINALETDGPSDYLESRDE